MPLEPTPGGASGLSPEKSFSRIPPFGRFGGQRI